MSATNDGGPAFPTDRSNDSSYTDIKGGMSLRDYFAAQALAGLLANPAHQVPDAECITNAYALADAMLEERAK